MEQSKFDPKMISPKNVQIKICLCRANETSGPHKEWNLNTYEGPGQKIRVQEGNNIVQNTFSSGFAVLVDTLERSHIEKEVLKEHIEICDINFCDKEPRYVQKVLEWLKAFDVIHILPGFVSKEDEDSIYKTLHSLRKKSIICSPCVATKRPPAPVDFPGHMVISVGCDKSIIKIQSDEINTDEEAALLHEKESHWQSCGSALDFICKGWSEEPAVEIKDPWEASYYTTGIAALVLVYAHALGK